LGWAQYAKVIDRARRTAPELNLSPSIGGQSKAVHKCVELYLRCFSSQSTCLWSKMLPSGMTPFIAVYIVKLVSVREKVTVFQVDKSLQQNATDIVFQWQQVVPHAEDRIFMRLGLQAVSTQRL